VARIIYVNGQYRRYADALVHAEDRGFQFADAIYEVIEVRDRCLVDATQHLVRLERSLSEIRMPMPMSDGGLLHVMGEVVRRNHVRDGLVYLQVTRGEGRRDFLFPSDDTPQTLVILARSQSRAKYDAQAEVGIHVVTVPDQRWGRCDIKTVMLLPACLAKDTAKAHGAKEAWFVDDAGFVREGASSNAWIVSSNGILVTRPLDTHILGGITRATVMRAAANAQLKVEVRAFSLAEAKAAREAFITAATNTVMPVTKIDGAAVSDGKVGAFSKRLRETFHAAAEMRAI
jgi:D-alanine transaminase